MPESSTTQSTRNRETVHSMQHMEITSHEPERFRDFCAKQFGWQFDEYPMPNGTYHMFRTPDGNGGGVMAPRPGQPIAVTPYINVEDLEATLKACEKGGATIVMPISEVPDQGRFFWFQVAGGPPLACWQQTAPKQ